MPVNMESPLPDGLSQAQSTPALTRISFGKSDDSRLQTIAGDTFKISQEKPSKIVGSRVKQLSKPSENSTSLKVDNFRATSSYIPSSITQPDVQKAKMGMDLQRLERRMTEITEEGEYYDIPKLGVSANPVGRLGDELFIPKEDIEELSKGGNVMKSKESMMNEVNRRASRVFHKQPKTGRDLINKNFGRYCKSKLIREGRKTRDPTVHEYLGQIREKIQDDAEEFSGESKAACEALLTAFEDIDKGVDLSSVPTRLDKEAVLSNLRIAIHLTDDSKELEKLTQLSNNVYSLSENFVTQDELASLPNADMKIMTRNLPMYVSSMDVMAENDYNPAIGKKMEQIADSKGAGDIGGLHNPKYADRPGYAYKMGNENHREVLAGQMADLLGVQEYLTPKLEATFTKGQLGVAKSPEGLASKWLSEGKPFDQKTFFRFTEMENKLFQKEMNGKSITDEERSQLKELRAELNPEINPGCPSPVSVNIQAWLDLATCSYDSHAAQYMVMDGEVHCFDFARFCAPAEAFKDDNMLMLTFRSTFIDHPSCQENMPPEIISTILGVNVKNFKDNLAKRGLLENKSFFDEHSQGIRQTVSDYQSINDGTIANERFRELCDKYDVSPEQDNAKKTVCKGLKKDYARLKKESFSKINPDALKGMIRRIEAGQKYIQSCEKKGEVPNMKGAFKAMMPAQATLHELFAKYSGADPGNRMAIDNIGGVVAPVNLMEWLNRIQDNMNPEDLKTAQEALATLKEQCCDRSEMCATMDIGDN